MDDKCLESVLFSIACSPGVFRLSGKCFYPLRHLADPFTNFIFILGLTYVIYMYKCFAYIYVGASCVYLVHAEIRRGFGNGT